MELSDSPQIGVVLLGGNLNSNAGRLITDGLLTVEAIKNIVVNKAFITVSGLTLEHGYFVENTSQADLFHMLKQNALELVVVINNSKFNHIGKVRFEKTNYFNKVVSSADVPDDYKQYYYDNGVTLYTSFKDI